MTEYVSYEQVVRANADHGGPGAGVRDEDGLRAQLGRVESSFGDVDLYPTLMEKAAVLLHGLSSTQCFHDGNKRTAWIVTKFFLGINGHPLRQMPAVEAEAFVLSIATKAFENDDEPTRGVERATEWLALKAVTMRDRYHFAFLAREVDLEDVHGGVFDAKTAMLDILIAPRTQIPIRLGIALHVNWLAGDAGEHQISVTSEAEQVLQLIYPTPDIAVKLETDPDYEPAEFELSWRNRLDEIVVALPAAEHPHREGRIPAPLLWIYQLDAFVFGFGFTRIRVDIDGMEIASLPLTVAASM